MKSASTLKVGIGSPAVYERLRLKETDDIARLTHKTPSIWFPTLAAFARLMGGDKARLLYLILTDKPASLTELADIAEKPLRSTRKDIDMLEKHGFVSLYRKGKILRPEVDYDTIQLDIYIDGDQIA